MDVDLRNMDLVPASDPFDLALLELAEHRDAHGRLVDLLVLRALNSQNQSCERNERRMASEVLGPVAGTFVEAIRRSGDEGRDASFAVHLAADTYIVRAYRSGPGQWTTLWAAATELLQRRHAGERDPLHAERVLMTDDRFTAIVDADDRCTEVWPGAFGAGRRPDQYIGRPVQEVLGYDPFDHATVARATDRVTVRALGADRRAVIVDGLPPEAAEAAALRLELERLRAMMCVVDAGVAVYCALRDDRGTIVDFVCIEMTDGDPVLAASEQIDQRLLELFPEARDNGTFDAYVRVVESGLEWAPAPLTYSRDGQDYEYRLRAKKFRDGFVLGWRDVLVEVRPTHERTSPATPAGGTRYALAERQKVILTLLAQGISTEDVARQVHLSPFTVRNEVRRILANLGCRSRAEAIARALHHGLIRLPD